jgi:hypothetical protein
VEQERYFIIKTTVLASQALRAARKLSNYHIDMQLEEVSLGDVVCLFRILVSKSNVTKAKQLLIDVFSDDRLLEQEFQSPTSYAPAHESRYLNKDTIKREAVISNLGALSA